MSSGIWAMMTLLKVFDCSFSDSFVHKFSAPKKNTPAKKSYITKKKKHIQYPSNWAPCPSHCQLQLITLFVFDSPHHEVHAGSVGLATKLEGTLFPWQRPRVMKYPLQLWLTAAKLLQYKVVHFTCKRWLHCWVQEELERTNMRMQPILKLQIVFTWYEKHNSELLDDLPFM